MIFQSGGRVKQSIWTDPSIGVGIKIRTEFRNTNGSPDITVRELTSSNKEN